MHFERTTEVKMRAALRDAARLRRRAGVFTAVSAALLSSGATWVALAASAGYVTPWGLALLAFAIAPILEAYWSWREVGRKFAHGFGLIDDVERSRTAPATRPPREAHA